VTTFLVLKTWRLLTSDDVYFHRFHLKFAGRLQKTGWAFLAFSIVWIGLNAHSGWIRYNEYKGNQAFLRLRIPDELALAQVDPAPWISPDDRENILAGRKHFQNGLSFGQAAARQKDEANALSLYYRGAILNRIGRFEEAQASLDQALAVRDNLILARQEKGESLWQLGRREEAIAVWTDALRRNPHLALAGNELAGAMRLTGRFGEASAYEQQADQSTPDDPLYHWMLGLRLRTVGMSELAEKHFGRAAQLDPRYGTRPR
jgi:tetratricopeptide (TPR) repeat protein